MSIETELVRYRFSADKFRVMHEHGVFRDPDGTKAVLLDGLLYDMYPPSPRRAGIIARLDTLLHDELGHTWPVLARGRISIDDWNILLPDLAVLRPGGSATGPFPTTADVGLVVEVAEPDATDWYRDVLRPVYDKAGIPEVWVVDLDAETVESGRGTAHAGETLTPVSFPDLQLPVTAMLG